MRWIFLALLFIPSLSFASVLELDEGSKTIEGVKLATTATVKLGPKPIALTSVGSGLRYKKVVFVKANVYVGQLFVSNAAAFQRTDSGALESLGASDAVAMHMHFLRDVDSKKLFEAFREAFQENEIPVNADPIKNFLNTIHDGAGAVKGKTLVVVGEKTGKRETISYEDSAGRVQSIEAGAGVIHQVFSLWLGKPADSGVENLKKEILAH